MIVASPDALFQSAFSRDISSLRTALQRASQELVTGRRSNILASSRGNSEPLLRAQAALDNAEQARARLTVLEGRYRVASSALRTIGELTESVALAAQSAGDVNTGVQADAFASVEARSAIGTVFSALEARFGGRALFGGTLGTGRVLADTSNFLADIQALVPAGTSGAAAEAALNTYFQAGGAFETNIYEGGNQLDDPQLADGSSIDALFTADSDELRSLYKGLAMVVVNEQVAEVDASNFLRRGAEVIQGAREALVGQEARMGLAQNAITREQERQEQNGLDAELTLEAALGRDPFEAAAETQALEARLQAAYTVTGRVGALRLANFLR